MAQKQLTIKDIQKFINDDYAAWSKIFNKEPKNSAAFVIMNKITKKTGDLAKEVNKEFGYASPRSMKDPMCLDVKLGGLIINACLLGKLMGYDVEKAVAKKMEMMRERAKMNKAMPKPAAKKPVKKIIVVKKKR